MQMGFPRSHREKPAVTLFQEFQQVASNHPAQQHAGEQQPLGARRYPEFFGLLFAWHAKGATPGSCKSVFAKKGLVFKL